MNNVVDSSAWLAFFTDSANAGVFAEPIAAVEQLLVPSIVIAEVYKVVHRRRGRREASLAAAHIQQGRVVPLDSGLAVAAAVEGLHHGLPMAAAIIYATARRHDALVWTQDADFEGLDGVNYVPAAGPEFVPRAT